MMHAPVPGTARTPTPTSAEPRWMASWKRLGTLRTQLREREHLRARGGIDADLAQLSAAGQPGPDDRDRPYRAWPTGTPPGTPPGTGDDGAARAPRRWEHVDVDAMLLGTSHGPEGTDGFQVLVDRLFRRLAQALHPDREPDERRRELKQELMGRALEARTARDLDTLLALHVQHIGEALPGIDPDVLEGALERQLEGMRRALTRSRRGNDPLRRGIAERYAGPDAATRLRLIARHAALLDRECARVTATLQALDRPDGLAVALSERRARELDRLAIDELTGMAD